MLYKISHSVSANTTADTPNWQKLRLCKGRISQWETWCHSLGADLLHWRVEYHGVQVLPVNRDEWMDRVHRPVTYPDDLPVEKPPYEIDVYAYNADTAKAHTYNLQVHVIPARQITPSEEEAGFWERMKGFIGMGD